MPHNDDSFNTAAPTIDPDCEPALEAAGDDREAEAAWLRVLARGETASRPLPAPGASTDAHFAALYGELKRSAAAHLRRENAAHTLSATALTHEAWFRLAEQTRTSWAGRGHFLGVASIMMRRILVNHALAKRAAKRDAQLVPLVLTEAQALADASMAGAGAEVLRVHEALLALEAEDARAAKVVELRFFGGLEIDEVAETLSISMATVKRDWAYARAWLHQALNEG